MLLECQIGALVISFNANRTKPVSSGVIGLRFSGEYQYVIGGAGDGDLEYGREWLIDPKDLAELGAWALGFEETVGSAESEQI